MCCLLGVTSSALTPLEREVFRKLSFLSCFRGTDSSGIITVHKGKKDRLYWNIFKAAINPVSLTESQGYEDLCKNSPFLLAGHARAATYGSITSDNAHPFEHSNIIGMHNGTIPILAPGKGEDRTDSDKLFELVSTIGIDKALDKAKYGAYAVCYLNYEDKTLNFARNEARPLHYMRGHGDLFVWASEARMLAYIKTIDTDFTDSIITQFDTGLLYSIKLGTTILTSRPLITPKPLYIEHKKPLVPQHDSPFKNSQIPEGYPYTIVHVLGYPPPKVVEPASEDANPRLAKFKYLGFQKIVYTLAEARDMLIRGCEYCTKIPKIANKIYWYEEDKFICHQCMSDDVIANYMSHLGNYSELKREE